MEETAVTPESQTQALEPITPAGSVEISDVRIHTSLPLKVVEKISANVTSIKIPEFEAQRILSRFEAALEDDVAEILADIYGTVVTSSDDKEGMSKQHALRMRSVKMRTRLDAVRAEEKQSYKNQTDYVDGAARGIRLALEEAEAHAKHHEKFKEREMEERLQKRYEERQALLHPFLAEGATEPLNLKQLSDEAFQAVLDSERAEYLERIRQVRVRELESFEAEVPAGVELLAPDDWAALRNKAKAAYEFAIAEKQRLASVRESRIKMLSQAGLKFDGAMSFVYDELSVNDAEIRELDDMAFATRVADLKTQIDSRVAAKNSLAVLKQASESRRIARINRLSALGMAFNGTVYKFEQIEFDPMILESEDDAVFEAAYARIEPTINSRKAEIAEEKRKADDAEAKRKAEAAKAERLRLAPDREKLADLRTQIEAIELPSVDPQFSSVLNEVRSHLTKATDALASFTITTEDPDCPF